MKVFFDHNMSPRIARALNELFKGEHECVALRDKFRKDIGDIEWITRLSKEDRWAVFSGDRRIKRNRSEYQIFRSSRLIGFFLSKGLQKAPVVKQTERILAQWDAIENQFRSVQGGAVFELQMKGTYLAQIKD